MTKKLFILGVILSSSLFAATDAQILAYFKSQIPIPSVKVTIISRLSMKDISGMDYVSLQLTDGTRIQKLSVFTKGDLIFPDIIDVHQGSIKEKFDKQKIIKQLSKLYQKEKPEHILVLGNDPQKETQVVFSDPECPFCGKEVDKIEETLKTKNLRYIFTPVHEKSAMEKSVLIYKQTKIAKNLQSKVKILKKYFKADTYEKVSDAEVATIEKTRTKYFAAGLKGVPFIINEKELLN